MDGKEEGTFKVNFSFLDNAKKLSQVARCETERHLVVLSHDIREPRIMFRRLVGGEHGVKVRIEHVVCRLRRAGLTWSSGCWSWCTAGGARVPHAQVARIAPVVRSRLLIQRAVGFIVCGFEKFGVIFLFYIQISQPRIQGSFT